MNWDKGDFTGRDAVLAQSEAAAEWKLVGFEVESGDADPSPSDPIFRDGEWAGYVSSACEGFRICKRIAMGYVMADKADTGGSFAIEVLGKPCPALLVPMPFYDPENSKLKG